MRCTARTYIIQATRANRSVWYIGSLCEKSTKASSDRKLKDGAYTYTPTSCEHRQRWNIESPTHPATLLLVFVNLIILRWSSSVISAMWRANWRHEGPPVYAMPQNLLKGAGHCGFSPSTFAKLLKHCLRNL